MKYIINREYLLAPLQQLVNVIEKRQTMPILSNVFMKFDNNQLSLTGTDLQIQIISSLTIASSETVETTVSARKLLDICKLLPNQAEITLELKTNKLIITSGRGRYALATLDASNFPKFSENAMANQFSIKSKELKKAFNKSIFCMANQDVRYYLNGLMIHIFNDKFNLVASNGHRLGRYEGKIEQATGYEKKLIIPRKGVLELSRLLDDSEQALPIQFSESNIKLIIGSLNFSAKLIDAQFPNFSRTYNQEFFDIIKLDRDTLKDALTRVAIFSNEKAKGIYLDFGANLLKMSSHNLEHEEAEEELSIDFPQQQIISISFNAQYLLEAISNIDSTTVHMIIAKNASTCLIEDSNDSSYQYIVMPLKN